MDAEIYFTRQQRAAWPDPLVSQWRHLCPDLFDQDDERLVWNQRSYHFKEWLAAIYLFHRDGTHVLLSKYAYRIHPGKVERLHLLGLFGLVHAGCV
jgi:hypothetical protein